MSFDDEYNDIIPRELHDIIFEEEWEFSGEHDENPQDNTYPGISSECPPTPTSPFEEDNERHYESFTRISKL